MSGTKTSESDHEEAVPEASLPVPCGSILAGKYRVDSVIASGGMGIVAAGEHVALAQRVAIKFLRGTATAERITRFLREAKACARIQSDHIARVFDVDTLADGMPFMVMEHLSGSDLSVVLKERARLPLPTAVDYTLQACEALAEAHREGIIHRDLKPANLFLTQRSDGSPLVKVLDFGISKFRSRPGNADPADELTTTNSLMGSPHYMSPEQLRSARNVDARADVWALGAVLYKLVAGRNPFVAETTPDLCIQILTEPVPPIEEVVLPEEFFSVLRWCLEKDVVRRCPNVAELAVALRPYAPPSALPSIDRVARTLDVEVPAEIRPPKQEAPCRVMAAISAILGCGAIGLGLVWGLHRAPTVAASPAPPPLASPPPPAPEDVPQAAVATSTPPATASAPPRVTAPPKSRAAVPRARVPSQSAAAGPSAAPTASDEFGSFGARK